MKEGTIDLPIGTKVRYKGKHGVVVVGNYECHNCILNCNGICDQRIACIGVERTDENNVYFKEIVQ